VTKAFQVVGNQLVRFTISGVDEPVPREEIGQIDHDVLAQDEGEFEEPDL
jgi:hypothetical protein